MNNTLKSTIAPLLIIPILLISCKPKNDKSEVSEKTTTPQETTWTPTQEAVKATVERFLFVAGHYNLEAMKEMMAEKGNLGVVAFKDNAWITSTLTFDEYFENAKTRVFTPYYEPVNEYIINMSEDQIALVRADATLHQFGVPRSNNIDNFTLIKEADTWKIINISFTKKALPPEKKIFDPEAFARGYSQAWSGRRPEFVAMHFGKNGSLRVNEGAPAIGTKAITNVAKGFMDAFPDMVVAMDSLITKSDGMRFYWTLTGTNNVPGGTGNKVKISGFEAWVLNDDGLIQESKGHFDAQEYKRQLEAGMDN